MPLARSPGSSKHHSIFTAYSWYYDGWTRPKNLRAQDEVGRLRLTASTSALPLVLGTNFKRRD
jgi:hypothetical protein